MSWSGISTRLAEVAAIVDEIAEDAAQLIADVPHRDSQHAKLDPRSSTVAAAQFVSSIRYEASNLQRKAEQIKIEHEKAAA